MSKVSILIPLYNEQELIAESLSALHGVLESVSHDFEILCIDDGSTDETWKVLQGEAKSYSNLGARRLSRNFGKESAIAAGLEVVQGDAVIIVDADGQHPFDLIPKMIQIWQQEDVLVVEGVKEDDHAGAPVRGLLSQCYYRLFYLFSGFDMSGASDFLLLDKRVVEKWQELGEYHLFFRGLIRWMGFSTKKITYRPAERSIGKTKFTPRKLFGLSINSIVSFSSLPLYLLSFFGVAFLIFAFVLVVQTFLQWLSGNALEGFTTVIMLQLFIGGLILCSLGIIGIYIARLYEEVKRRPRYIVAESLSQ